MLGQSPPQETAPAPDLPATQSAAALVSGFEVVNAVKNPKEMGNPMAFYPMRVLTVVRNKWLRKIRAFPGSTDRKPGFTTIEFEINPDGSLRKMNIVESADDAFLDAAASEAISSSVPFDMLPADYQKNGLTLRMHFGYYQPANAGAPFCDGPNWGAHPTAYPLHYVGNGITPPRATYAPDPEYSERARKDKYMSVVQIAGTVDPRGIFADLCVAQAAGEGLDEEAMKAVKTWKFDPATLHGEPVAVRINVEVTFRLY